jgi:uncharacterized protein (TIGR00730 family)
MQSLHKVENSKYRQNCRDRSRLKGEFQESATAVIKSVCVFCGSSRGNDPVYTQAAKSLGKTMADKDLRLVYVGGNIGLMKEVADAVLENRGKVVGVIPQALMDWELGHNGLSELKIVNSMHDRKKQMSDLADAFIALPGGLGTLEELFEIATWAQLGIHSKPCGLLNVAGYYDHMRTFLDHMVEEGFLKKRQLDMIMVANSADELFAKFEQFKPQFVKKWIDETKT